MIGLVIAIILAAIIYFICIALGLPFIIAVVAALLVLICGIGTGGYGGNGRWGNRGGGV